MCGRFAFFGNGHFGYESLHLPEAPSFENYNVTPSQDILTIRSSPETGLAEYALLHWGLIPFWSKTEKTKFPLINARADGIEKKPSFRGPFKHRRCIIPVSGFYEWQHQGERKQPFFIQPANGGYFALAGLWDHWQGEDGEEIESCAIITTEANNLMRTIHDRMPVILASDSLLSWLDSTTSQEALLLLLVPCRDELIHTYPVSARVNNPRHNDKDCIQPVDQTS